MAKAKYIIYIYTINMNVIYLIRRKKNVEVHNFGVGSGSAELRRVQVGSSPLEAKL